MNEGFLFEVSSYRDVLYSGQSRVIYPGDMWVNYIGMEKARVRYELSRDAFDKQLVSFDAAQNRRYSPSVYSASRSCDLYKCA